MLHSESDLNLILALFLHDKGLFFHGQHVFLYFFLMHVAVRCIYVYVCAKTCNTCTTCVCAYHCMLELIFAWRKQNRLFMWCVLVVYVCAKTSSFACMYVDRTEWVYESVCMHVCVYE